MPDTQTPPTYHPDQLLSDAETCDFLGVNRYYLANARCAKTPGMPPYVRIGRRTIKYRVRDLLAYLDRQTVGNVND